ncbi:MAG TPA: hypothetical protein VG317_01060, partial [Pseudonocardiaceae bacterium]|nr:hypothetical protein [Pseudonocardiaceae bacterium]
MVAIIRCSQDEEKLLDFHQGRFADDFPQWPWITSRRNSEWENGSHLTLIVTGVYRGNPVVSRLGWLGALGKADDLNKKLPITRIYSMDDPLPVETLLNHLPSTNRRYVKNEGPQSKGTGDAIIGAVLDLRPGWADVVITVEGLSRG